MKTEISNWNLHLRERGLTSNIRRWTSIDNQEILFPLWTPTGKLVGYQKYAWNQAKLRSNVGKYYTWITPEYRPLGVWGWEYSKLSETIFIVEGIWDAISVVNCGYSALAILTASPAKQLTRWLKTILMYRKAVAILDNDENKAGNGLIKLSDYHHYLPQCKDTNELFIKDKQLLCNCLKNWS